MIAIGAASIYFAASSVFAEGLDDITSDTIVNFNQIINPANNVNTSYYTYNNGTYNFNVITNWININEPISILSNHKYYACFNSDTENIRISLTNNIDYGILNSLLPVKTIIEPNVSKDNMVLMFNGNNQSFKSTGYIIDLTQMFGETVANTITIEQCENYFTADYYPYNTGTPIPFSVDYMNGYINGVNDTLNNFQYILNNDTVQVSMQDVNFGNYYGEVTKYSNYVRADGISDKYTCCYLPFISPIPQGAHFKVRGQFTHNDGNASVPIVIAYLQDGQLFELARQRVTGGYANAYTYEFDSPANINGFYFYLDDDSGAAITIYNTTVEVLNVDYAAILYSAAENAKAQVEKNYLPRNPGYEAIFAAGYQKGQQDGNAALTSMDYIQSAFISLGEILAIQVFPNVPLGTFFLLPLMASLIFFIVKVSKGG